MSTEQYRGRFFRRLYRSDDGSYCAMLYQDKGKTTCVVGSNLPETNYAVTFEGHWVNDPKYGMQFHAERIVNALPQNEKDLIQFLSSMQIGIGIKTAQKMISVAGAEQFFYVLNHQPERFLALSGVNAKQIETLRERASEMEIQQNLVKLFAGDLPMDTRQYKRICKFFGSAIDTAVSTIQENPFILMQCGYTFEELDYFGRLHTGYAVDDRRRLLAAAQQALLDAKQYSHVALPLVELRCAMQKLLLKNGSVYSDTIDGFLNAAVAAQSVYCDNGLYYLPRAYEEEVQIANAIAKLLNKHEKKVDRNAFSAHMEKYAQEKGFRLSPDQETAVWTALSQSFCIITGGPGTGKSTILDALLYCWKHFFDDRWLLMAPTGKAAVRMTETTSELATTIHSSLGLAVGDESIAHMDNSVCEQYHSLIVVDECSMLDQTVTASLTLALKSGFQHLVIVGDPDQLPSVGWGNVLADMIESGVLPICRLNTIYRQGEGNPIIANSQRMLNGITELDFSNRSFKNFHYGTDESNMEAACKFYQSCAKHYGIENVMLLSPYRKATAICTNRLNERLQNMLNTKPGQVEIHSHGRKFRMEDRVMQLKNTDVLSNGDIGTITYLNPSAHDTEPCLTVQFESGFIQEYKRENLSQLDLAYALSVHKSQGSQAKHVIVILPCRFSAFLKRNLLYTAITRSSLNVAIFGPREIIASIISNDKKDERYTGLVARLRKVIGSPDKTQGAA